MAEKILPRLSEEEMQTYIETELTEASKVLPANYKKGDKNYGRFTAGLAHTVLLKLYMLTKQWDKAEAEGRELMKPEYGFELVPEYKDIFTLANEKNPGNYLGLPMCQRISGTQMATSCITQRL